MGKVIFWLVIVFAVLFALRLLSASKAKRRGDAARRSAAAGGPGAESMVRCVRCGVFLPRAEAKVVPGGHACADPACAERR
jgi:hypothetical protein